MHADLTHLQTVPLPLPPRGASTRLRLDGLELVLEQQRASLSLLCLDGAEARTWTLGLGDDGQLLLQCRAPRFPLAVTLPNPLTLMPGGRVRGFVQMPLVPTILWRRSGAAGQPDQVVAELLPRILAAEWDEQRQLCVQRFTSAFYHRMPPPAASVLAVLPLTVVNRSPHMQSLATLPLAVTDDELSSARGHVVAAPRRLLLNGGGGVTATVRGQWRRAPCAG